MCIYHRYTLKQKYKGDLLSHLIIQQGIPSFNEAKFLHCGFCRGG